MLDHALDFARVQLQRGFVQVLPFFSVTPSRPGLGGGPFTHSESMQLSGRTPTFLKIIMLLAQHA
jgi:hypothetical protein